MKSVFHHQALRQSAKVIAGATASKKLSRESSGQSLNCSFLTDTTRNVQITGRRKQFKLGLKFDTGDGLPADSDQATKWYFEAASKGYPEACNNLGRCFAMGEGVERNDVEAYKWFNIAAELGVANAGRYRERVAKELSPDERVMAGELSDKWLVKLRVNSV